MAQAEEELRKRVERALSAKRWRPTDPDLYRMFQDSTDQFDRESTRVGVRAAVICFLLFGLYDLWLLPDVGRFTVATRFLIGFGFLGVVEWQTTSGRSMAAINATCAGGLATAALGWILVADHTQYQTSFAEYIIFGTVFVVSSSLFFRIRFWVGSLGSTLITVMFAWAALAAEIDPTFKIILVTFFVSFLCLALYLSWQLAAERYVTFLNATRAQLNELAVREKSEQLARIANTDHLTGLKNRRAVVAEYAVFRERWLREGTPIGVLLIDVDHFKAYNDHYGHQSGDRCLVDVARALQSAATAAGGVLARYGGEEFIAFTHVADRNALFGFAEAIRKSVEAFALPHSKRRDGTGIVTVSIGASITRSDENSDLDRMSSEADNALYSAKANGRNATQVYDPKMPQTENEDRNIAIVLDQALDHDLVSLAYQPIVDVATGEVHAFEALMRLRGPEGTPIPPSVFIPVAERTGAIVSLGRWALRTACTQILKAGLAPKLSVNLSAVQLREASFPLFVAGLLSEMNLAPSSLALEITEGFDIASDPCVLEAIAALRNLGIEIWLDDFGTGYAGLSWLQSIDFTLVKIDQRFLQASATPEGERFLKDILQLVRRRGLSVVLEGVETPEQMAFLERAEVPLAQGYYLGRPVSVDAAASLKRAVPAAE
ncbi:putative bifunctional diguanylate cyclase/phosphodiesterase [Jiella sonneratiae]|uniref:EAL domain-containing protein n=1 Tax=Jiella sonneratiae TaxID=2816856 RepID=A0ABS3J1K2_9HYPH|nr:GGDEF domain-containing phosphodiesterase [Jiella sonneratiae]MBO0902977.1 EAL domain-containing protein [Jiella sonneratiae]